VRQPSRRQATLAAGFHGELNRKVVTSCNGNTMPVPFNPIASASPPRLGLLSIQCHPLSQRNLHSAVPILTRRLSTSFFERAKNGLHGRHSDAKRPLSPKEPFTAKPLHPRFCGFVLLSEYGVLESLGTAHFIGGVKNRSVQQSFDRQAIIIHSVTVDSC